ncbi:MAG: N-succinyl-L-Arg/Lys racemase [Firmicutes bacterium]|nr:N-succinyl-L-Arg/Lys racemase [candidate division NPL-UPA2 bacterium]MBT9153853.1 N-succinyl-L-Arg/Lys racemase [candidate division NPL-UPA2 bacterium]
MKVVAAELRELALPLKQPFVIAYNTWRNMPTLVLSLFTDEGLVGYGESVPDEGVTGETISSTLAMLRDTLLPLVLGRSAFDLEAFHRAAEERVHGAYAAKAAIDIALHDLKAKACGVPLYKLLGGHCQAVTVPAVISIIPPDEMPGALAPYQAQGYRQYKLKLGGKPEDDIRRVKVARETLGKKARIKVDANQGFATADNALKIMQAISRYDIELVEQPVKHWDYEGLRRVRERSDISLMVDEGVRTGRDLWRLLSLTGIDWVNVKLMKCGGLLPAMKLAALAEIAGVKVQVGSMLESSIASAAGAHLHRALPAIYASEMVGPHHFAADIGDFSYRHDEVFFSERAGLGIEVDRERLASLMLRGIRISEHGENSALTSSGVLGPSCGEQ